MIDREFKSVSIAVITVSDTRTVETDKSGDTLVDRISSAGHHVAGKFIVKDEVRQIRSAVRKLLGNAQVDAIISTGGTGLTGRDVTVEAMRGLFEKEIEGFGVIFHMISFGKINTSTIQSRATAGVAKGKYIFCLPGSPSACKDAWDNILVHQFDYRHKPCNFVEIMPRLGEGRKS